MIGGQTNIELRYKNTTKKRFPLIFRNLKIKPFPRKNFLCDFFCS